MLGFDFSTVFIQYVSPAQAAQLATQYGHALIGYDTSPQSMMIRQSIVGAGMLWSPYRFLSPSSAGRSIDGQVGDCLTATADAVAAGQSPALFVLDIEENNDGSGVAPSIADIERAMDLVEAKYPVKGPIVPTIYTGKWVWDKHYVGYTGPADRGWHLITANWNGRADLNVPLYGGWTAAQLVGHQYQGSTPTNIGAVDLDYFVDWLGGVPVKAQIDQAIALLEQVKARL